MPQIAANLSFLFTDLPFLDRFQAAADQGFRAVEFLFPYGFPASAIRARANAAGVSVILFNVAPGDWDAGDRGLSSLAGRGVESDAAVRQALDYAEEIDCRTLHLLAGVYQPTEKREVAINRYVGNLRVAADLAADRHRTITIEPLNTRDVPGYLLQTSDEAAAIIARVDRPNVGLQFDCYHVQIMEGDLSVRLAALMPIIRHVQIAGVPDRGEPDAGELNPHHLFLLLDKLGYQGWIGCEYHPRVTTETGLAWASRYLGRDENTACSHDAAMRLY
jgi:hydroxypyruvate isomerase